MALIVNR